MSSGFWFRLHERGKTAQDYWRERRERRQRQLSGGLPLTLAAIADRDALFEAYRACRRDGGDAPGVDGVRLSGLSPTEAGELLGLLSQRLLKGTYKPAPTREVKIPKPGTDQTRTLQLPVVLDRVVAKALQRGLEPLWERVFLNCSWGFRPGVKKGKKRGAWAMLADLEARMVAGDAWVLAVDDVKSAFENVPIPELLASHQRMLDELPVNGLNTRKKRRWQAEKKKIMRLIEAVVSGDREHPARGIGQGNNYSPLALNALLHYHLDLPLGDTKELPLWYRYADNVCGLCHSVPEGEKLLSGVNDRLNPLGMHLKGQDGVYDLKAGGEAQLLGFTLSLKNGVLTYGLAPKAVQHLGDRLLLAHTDENPTQTARQAFLGWIDSCGPAFETGMAMTHDLLTIAAKTGFREVASPDTVQRLWERAWYRWQDLRTEVANLQKETPQW